MMKDSGDLNSVDDAAATGSTPNRRVKDSFKRSYHSQLPEHVRMQLIVMVIQQRKTIVEATRALGLKYTTGIQIVTRFRRTGTYLDMRFKKNRV